jgi:hypothetical protein
MSGHRPDRAAPANGESRNNLGRPLGRGSQDSDRLGRQRIAAGAVITMVVAASLITGWLWPTSIDRGGDTSGNPIAQHGPHWLFTTILVLVVGSLAITLSRTAYPRGVAAGIIAFTAGGAANLAQWVVLGGVRNPIGPLPAAHGAGHASIGDACLIVGSVIILVAALTPRESHQGPQAGGVDGAARANTVADYDTAG